MGSGGSRPIPGHHPAVMRVLASWSRGAPTGPPSLCTLVQRVVSYRRWSDTPLTFTSVPRVLPFNTAGTPSSSHTGAGASIR